MFTKFYRLRNILSVGTHYTATAGVVTGAAMLGQPWIFATSIILTGGLSYYIGKKVNAFASSSLTQHPDVHEFSPRLGEMVKDLYQKAGLKSDSFEIYDFKADKKETIKSETNSKTSLFNDTLRKLFNTMSNTHNAAAMHAGKPIIMISEPLLKLLDDKEEKAVLAHEFTHAAARHSYLGLPTRLAATAATLTAGAAYLIAAVEFPAPLLTALGAGIATRFIIKKIHPDSHLLDLPEKELTLSNLVKIKKRKNIINVTGQTVVAAVLTYFSPAILGVYAAFKGIKLAGKIITGTFSRSMEYQADRGVVDLGADPLALVTALRKMTVVMEKSKNEAFGGNVPKAGVLTRSLNKIIASHPTMARRIDRLAAMAKKQGADDDSINKAVSGPISVSNDNNIPYHVIKELMKL